MKQLEIGFIEEMGTTWGNLEVPLTFSTIFLIRENTVLIRLTSYHWQPSISQYCNITKAVL